MKNNSLNALIALRGVLDAIGKMAHAVLDLALAATFVWLMLNYRDILGMIIAK